MEQLGKDFKENSIFRIRESMRMLQICRDISTPEMFWFSPNLASNSIGNLLLHLCGNMRQYVISGLGGAPDARQREEEFRKDLSREPDVVWGLFLNTVNEVLSVIENADTNQLSSKKWVQGFHLSGLGMVLHAVEHLSYHTGQIAWILKAHQNCDLGFYTGMDLNIKNQTDGC